MTDSGRPLARVGGLTVDDGCRVTQADPGGQLVFGFAYRSAAGTQWRLGIQEDPIIDASPDFVIHLSVDWGAGAQ